MCAGQSVLGPTGIASSGASASHRMPRVLFSCVTAKSPFITKYLKIISQKTHLLYYQDQLVIATSECMFHGCTSQKTHLLCYQDQLVIATSECMFHGCTSQKTHLLYYQDQLVIATSECMFPRVYVCMYVLGCVSIQPALAL
jgi:hypothetical protein